MKEKLYTFLKELYLTLSSKKSLLSSKRLERFAFVSTSLALVIGTFVFLIVKSTLVATDTIILISPLLVAAGFNLTKTQEEKKDEPTDKV